MTGIPVYKRDLDYRLELDGTYCGWVSTGVAPASHNESGGAHA